MTDNLLSQSILLPNVLNHRWLAECAKFASIVIELVIGNYYPLQTTITFKHYKLQRLF